MHIRTHATLAVLTVGLCSTLSPNADDWPHWMGPDRDNVWKESGILERFPAGGPKVLWRTPIAGGYSGPAVAHGRAYITDYVTSENVKVANFERKNFTGVERTLCLDEMSGEVLWKHEYPVKYSISYPAGPRCTPVVDGDRMYTGNFLYVLGGKLQAARHPAVEAPVALPVKQLTQARRAATVS